MKPGQDLWPQATRKTAWSRTAISGQLFYGNQRLPCSACSPRSRERLDLRAHTRRIGIRSRQGPTASPWRSAQSIPRDVSLETAGSSSKSSEFNTAFAADLIVSANDAYRALWRARIPPLDATIRINGATRITKEPTSCPASFRHNHPRRAGFRILDPRDTALRA
jgi:hypothetical protein